MQACQNASDTGLNHNEYQPFCLSRIANISAMPNIGLSRRVAVPCWTRFSSSSSAASKYLINTSKAMIPGFPTVVELKTKKNVENT